MPDQSFRTSPVLGVRNVKASAEYYRPPSPQRVPRRSSSWYSAACQQLEQLEPRVVEVVVAPARHEPHVDQIRQRHPREIRERGCVSWRPPSSGSQSRQKTLVPSRAEQGPTVFMRSRAPELEL